ncbi:MAG TPA: hypothetical protein VJU78_16380, partial [Chitinophagaceae bacterium]|nr:hypothetical protein [Chitinophagaceae bacterium]
MSNFVWHSKKIVLVFSFMAIAVIKLFATDEKYKSLPMEGSSGQIRKDSVRTVADTVFFNPVWNATVLNTYSVQNVITFKINEYANRVLPDSFKVKLKFTIDFTNNLNQVITKIDSLTIDYNKLKSYTNKSVYLQTGYYKSVLKILDVIPIYGDSSVFLPSLMVENEIWINRDYQFNCSNNAIRTVNKDISSVAADGELKVFWTKERTADEYDLEWSYIDSTAVGNYYYSGTSNFDPAKIFDDNASRVSIKREDYKIPLLYDNGGILFFRVRSVQVKPNSQRIEANWSSDYIAQNGLGRFDFEGHERNLNWQATTTYAEEGKRKSVVQYFDGSLKGRQTVTKDNSTNTTVVAETFYDFQGRPVIQVLPSPTLSSIIKFTPDFNPAINGAEYDKERYDYELTNPNDYCARGAEALGIQSGASKYYSVNNPEKTDGFNKFIPDANAFPFTETVYTQDNTGRIIKQSGVGLDFKIGSGHETKYYYGSADQEELDALFGTEVGNATHYFKNMVRDANGQFSVSYVDMRGRTIATALAGDNPSSLDKLSSNVLRTITKKLIDSTNNQVRGTLIESSKALLVPKSGSHRFIYSLAPDSIRIATCASTNICYDCMYDLEITITDDCNNSFNNGNPVRIVRSNVKLNPADTLCNPFTAFPQMDTTLILAEGSYLVTKRLTISKPAMDYYRDSIFLAKNTCKKLEDFIEEEKQILRQQLQCEPECQSCMTSLGSWESFRNKFMEEMGISPQDSASYRTHASLAYQRQLEECNELCEQRGLHKSLRQAMLMDMTAPFGQYADPDLVDNYSIFYKSSTNSPYVFQTVSQPYLDADGKPDSIVNKDGVKVPPAHNSISKEEFEKNFKESWAENLLPLHPEFCKLQKIEEPGIAASYNWDERFEKTETYQAAVDSGYLNPTANSSAPFNQFSFVASKRDPFFNPAVNPAYANTWRSVMESKMLQPQSGTPINIWSLATAMVKCNPDDNTCFNNYATNQHAFEIDAACTGDKDMAWRNFRELYMNEKRKIIDQILSGLPCQSNVIAVPPHTLNFPPFAASTTGSGPQDAGSGRTELNQFIEENCRLYASQWWNQLKPCNFTLTDSAVIIPRLIQVCKEGGDENRVFGSSSVAPGSGYHFKSFQHVLQHYADSIGKVITSNACNPYLITDPPPYDQPAIYSNIDQWNKPDSCQCSRIDTLYSDYQQNPSGYSSFSAYVNGMMSIEMSETDLQTLRGLCNGTITCNYLATPITLPPSLQCGGAKACISCKDIALAYSQFLIEYPNAHKLSSDDTTVKVQYYLFLENYLNVKLSYRKSYSEYLSFMNDCGIDYYIPSTTVVTNAGPLLNMPLNGNSSVANISCDTLQNILNQFYAAYPNLDKWNLITLKRKQVFFPYQEYLLSCAGSGGTLTTGQTTNPAKWMGSGFRTSPSQWYRNNLTFMRFNFKTLNGKHTIDSINLRVSPILTDPFQAGISFGNMSTLWDSTLTCSQLGISFWAGKTPVFTPLYQYTSAQGNPIYTYNCRTSMLNLFRFPTTYKGNILSSDLPAGVPSNNASFIGSSNPIAQSDTAAGPRVIVIYRIDTIYSCENLVTDYFNYRLNSRLTYDSLKSLYLQKCGAALPFSCQSVDSSKLCGLKDPIFPTKYVEQYSPCDDSTNFAVVKGTLRYEAYRDSLLNVFEEAYLNKCLKVAKTESFTVNLPVNEYHYTLYYYDQAGNLVKTIPPEGVDVSKF